MCNIYESFIFNKETAEQLVNRLHNQWLTSNIFANNVPLTLPECVESRISGLQKLDEIIYKKYSVKKNTGETETEILLWKELDKQSIQNIREHFVLLTLTRNYAAAFQKALETLKSTPPPKPTHRQDTKHQAQNYLRLVVNE